MKSADSGCLLALIALVLVGVILAPIGIHLLDNQIAAVGEARAAEAWARAAQEQARADQERARAEEAAARAAAVIQEEPARQTALTGWLISLGIVLLVVFAGLGLAAIWRASLIYPNERGLYPVVPAALPVKSLNEPGAQSLSIAPRAAMQILPPSRPDPLPAIPEPVVIEGDRLAQFERLLLSARKSSPDTEVEEHA